MRAAAALLALSAAAPVAAEDLTERQQAAFNIILPELELSLTEQGGADMAAMAPTLATCVVTIARGREVRRLGDGPFDDQDVDLMNEIMARPDLQSCLIQAVGQG